MPSRKMRTAIYFFYGLDVEIRPKMDPPELFIHLGGVLARDYDTPLSSLHCCASLGFNSSSLQIAADVFSEMSSTIDR